MVTCDRTWEVDALREGRLGALEAASFERHLKGCEVCRRKFGEDERMRELGKALPPPVRDEVRERRMRREILRRAAPDPRHETGRSRRIAALVLGIAMALLALVVVVRARLRMTSEPRPAATAAAFAGTVRPDANASWSQWRVGTVEHVRVDRGGVAVEVRHQEPGERFLVDLPDGEIEVRGTRFDVAVDGGRTSRVRVFAGRVALRLDGQGERELASGKQWPAPVEPLDVAPAAADSSAAKPMSVTSPVPGSSHPPLPPARSSPAASSVPSSAAGSVARPDDAGAYAAAVLLYRAGHYDEAAHALHQFASAHPEAQDAEDAAFLEASALARAGRVDAAAVVAERFLEHYPESIHALDAAVLVARAARDRGDCPASRSALARWSKAPLPEAVRAALGSCAP